MAIRRKMLLALLCLLVLCSCDFVIADTESLLTPPTLNQQQAEVNSALKSILNLDDITYRYPQRGDHRSPFVLFDLDGDGREEALFFYAFNNDPTSSRMMILRQLPSGQWESVRDFSSVSDQVNFVEFARLLDKDSYCVIIGWRSTMGQESLLEDNFLSIYSLEPGGTANIEVQRQPYLRYMVRDFDGDGLDEIVTVARDRAQAMYVTLLRSVAHSLDDVAVQPLNSQSERLLSITSGKLWDESKAVYIDVVRSDGSTATEIFRVNSTGLTLLVGGEPPPGDETAPQWDDYPFTWRDDAIISRDFNDDGAVEIPELTVVPGPVAENEDPLWLVRLMIYGENGFEMTGKSIVINEADGYFVYYPGNWMDHVTVQRDDEIHEWKFFLLDEAQESTTIELLRITTYSGGDDGPVGSGEIDLGTFGTRRYVGYIPAPAPGVPYITDPQLREMFSLLPQA